LKGILERTGHRS